MSTKTKFNAGKLSTTDIDEQYNDKFWSKGAIREAMRKRTFSQLGDRLTQPKHFGDEIVKERALPILHPMNQLDGGVDATTATLLQVVFYSYDAAGALIGTFETRDYANATTAEAAAVAAHGGTGSVRNGAGSLYNGDADYSVVAGSFPSLSEEGGNVNGVNTKSITVRGNVAEFGAHMKFTQRAIDMDSRTGILAQKTKDLGELKGDLFEAQVQADLIAASELNRTFAGTVATTLKTCNQAAVLTYADLRLMEQELKRLLVPRDTKIITGSTKIGTKVIQKAFYVYVGQELYPTLQDMQHNSVNVWEPLESYADAAGSNVAMGEIGRIGGFRFIEVENMLKYAGVGATDGAALDDTAGFQASTIPFGTVDAGSQGFDVFPVLFVGSDSFATVGFEGDSARIKTAMPKADAINDPFGKNGSMSIAWYFGTLIYKSERIRQIACTASIL
jgi:N4-gp56 family major capsid protein